MVDNGLFTRISIAQYILLVMTAEFTRIQEALNEQLRVANQGPIRDLVRIDLLRREISSHIWLHNEAVALLNQGNLLAAYAPPR